MNVCSFDFSSISLAFNVKSIVPNPIVGVDKGIFTLYFLPPFNETLSSTEVLLFIMIVPESIPLSSSIEHSKYQPVPEIHISSSYSNVLTGFPPSY